MGFRGAGVSRRSGAAAVCPISVAFEKGEFNIFIVLQVRPTTLLANRRLCTRAARGRETRAGVFEGEVAGKDNSLREVDPITPLRTTSNKFPSILLRTREAPPAFPHPIIWNMKRPACRAPEFTS